MTCLIDACSSDAAGKGSPHAPLEVDTDAFNWYLDATSQGVINRVLGDLWFRVLFGLVSLQLLYSYDRSVTREELVSNPFKDTRGLHCPKHVQTSLLCFYK